MNWYLYRALNEWTPDIVRFVVNPMPTDSLNLLLSHPFRLSTMREQRRRLLLFLSNRNTARDLNTYTGLLIPERVFPSGATFKWIPTVASKWNKQRGVKETQAMQRRGWKRSWSFHSFDSCLRECCSVALKYLSGTPYIPKLKLRIPAVTALLMARLRNARKFSENLTPILPIYAIPKVLAAEPAQ